MNWGSIHNFLAMGGHAEFVWGSYGLTLIALLWELWSVRQRQRRARQSSAPPSLAQHSLQSKP